jgi:RNA polymerase sigma-70 factor (ECF subfamily)
MIGRDDDRDLIADARRGDPAAFGALVRRYQDRLYPTLLRLTGQAQDAHDLLQDTFLRAYQKLGRFHGDSSFYTWIYRIAVNLALSDRRKRRPIVGLPGRDDPEGGSAREPAADTSRTDPSLPLEQDERDALVQRALNALSTESRAVVVMKDLDGLSYEEIATTLQIPIGTVRSRLHRARMELRDRLRGILDPDDPPPPPRPAEPQSAFSAPAHATGKAR